jgi:hypothetical protein
MLGCVGLAALCLWSASWVSAQVRGEPASREPLPSYAQSNSPKPAENEAPAPVRPLEDDKKPALAAPSPSSLPASASDKVQVTALRFLSS